MRGVPVGIIRHVVPLFMFITRVSVGPGGWNNYLKDGLEK